MTDKPVDWEAFKDVVRVSNKLAEMLEEQRKKSVSRFGKYLPYSVRMKIKAIDAKMAENDQLLVELARALVREEDGGEKAEKPVEVPAGSAGRGSEPKQRDPHDASDP
jgi:hypothetical protein